ncbi:MAG TPA: hypothetical protein VNM48_14710, partial [Chloroflexota bacterium]|nr:hypothetical protein [Chloroflexota bacterium]
MARLRTIKPGFYTDEDLGECEPLARILYTGLWCQADREGRLEDRPRRLKVEVLPWDACDVDALLNELASRGLIVRYAVAGQRYIAIPTFLKHQNPHIKEAASTIPAPEENLPSIYREGEHHASTVQAPDEHHASRAGVGSGEWGGESMSGHGSGLSPTPSATERVAPDADAPDAPRPPAPLARAVLAVPKADQARKRDPIWDAVSGIFGEPLTEGEREKRA